MASNGYLANGTIAQMHKALNDRFILNVFVWYKLQRLETRKLKCYHRVSSLIIRDNCAQCPIGQMTTYCSSCMSHKVPKNFIQWRSRAVGTRGPGISSWGLRTSDKLSRRKKKGRVSSMRSIFWENCRRPFDVTGLFTWSMVSTFVQNFRPNYSASPLFYEDMNF